MLTSVFDFILKSSFSSYIPTVINKDLLDFLCLLISNLEILRLRSSFKFKVLEETIPEVNIISTS